MGQASLTEQQERDRQALAAQFARAGTEGLERPQIFDAPEVRRAGGIAELKALGKPAELLRETKERLFAA